jgi:hypothetical protein
VILLLNSSKGLLVLMLLWDIVAIFLRKTCWTRELWTSNIFIYLALFI